MIRSATPRRHFPPEPEAEAFRDGDPEAMCMLFERYRPDLVDRALSFLGRFSGYRDHVQRCDAEDVVQELFCRVWMYRTRPSHYRLRGRVYVWLRSCLWYTICSRYRRETCKTRRWHLYDSLDAARDDFDFDPSGGTDPAAQAADREIAEVIQDEIETFDLPLRIAMTKWLEGCKFAEIGEAIGGRTRERARQRVNEGISRIKDRFVPHPAGEQ